MTGGDGAAAFEPTDRALDGVASPVGIRVDGQMRPAGIASGALWDVGADASASEIGEHRFVAVGLVTDQAAGTAPWTASGRRETNRVHQSRAHGDLMALSGAQHGGERHAVAVGHKVDPTQALGPALVRNRIERVALDRRDVTTAEVERLVDELEWPLFSTPRGRPVKRRPTLALSGVRPWGWTGGGW